METERQGQRAAMRGTPRGGEGATAQSGRTLSEKIQRTRPVCVRTRTGRRVRSQGLRRSVTVFIKGGPSK
jgi:hypothetical protein